MDTSRIAEISLALGTGGILVEVTRGLYQRRKLSADYAQVIAMTATNLLKPLSERVAELENDLETERGRVAQLESALHQAYKEIRELRAQIRTLDGKE